MTMVGTMNNISKGQWGNASSSSGGYIPRMRQSSNINKYVYSGDSEIRCPTLEWRHNERDGVLNHRHIESFTQPFVQAQIKENINRVMVFHNS